MKRFRTTLNCVKEINRPVEGEVFIAKDHEKRLGDDTWMVCRAGDKNDHYGPDYEVLGIFYMEALALFFYSKVGLLEWADLKAMEKNLVNQIDKGGKCP